MPPLTDEALRALLVEDPDRGWRVFIDQYTPLLLALIERAGLTSHDEAMEVYVLVCDRLVERDCERLRRRDPAKGGFSGWLAVVVRNVIVDWIRSRAGRRRLFGAIKQLDAFDRRVFELYYWDDRQPHEIVDVLSTELTRRLSIADVLDAIDRIDRSMTDRHRRELLSFAVRARIPTSLDNEATTLDIASTAPDPEVALRVREADEMFAAALASLPAEDAAIVRLRYVQGLTLKQIQTALRLDRLTDDRLRAILDALRGLLASTGASSYGVARADFTFLEGERR